ncbi:MAG: hypothetical protein JRI86_02870 [Deltaproteobacteria bacterium]|nr:hypothetical protein [Deltaproteobacteria bacterium]
MNTAEEHYEEKFEFELWKMIKERANEKDISYLDASKEVLPEYIKTIRYRDDEFERTEIEKRQKELDALE